MCTNFIQNLTFLWSIFKYCFLRLPSLFLFIFYFFHYHYGSITHEKNDTPKHNAHFNCLILCSICVCYKCDSYSMIEKVFQRILTKLYISKLYPAFVRLISLWYNKHRTLSFTKRISNILDFIWYLYCFDCCVCVSISSRFQSRILFYLETSNAFYVHIYIYI